MKRMQVNWLILHGLELGCMVRPGHGPEKRNRPSLGLRPLGQIWPCIGGLTWAGVLGPTGPKLGLGSTK